MLREHGELIMKNEEYNSDLFRLLLGRFSASRDLVIDLYAGSFSSALAAMSSGRKYIGNGTEPLSLGFEIDDARYELGTLRLLNEAKVMMTFGHLVLPSCGPDDV